MTAQAHEHLILDGQPTTLACCPALPLEHPRLVRIPERHIRSTGCWRGYVGTWEIRQDVLYLCSVDGLYSLSGDEPLLADWVTESLRVPCGKLLRYTHMEFLSVYEEECFITVEKGRVTGRRWVDHRGKTAEEALPRRPTV